MSRPEPSRTLPTMVPLLMTRSVWFAELPTTSPTSMPVLVTFHVVLLMIFWSSMRTRVLSSFCSAKLMVPVPLPLELGKKISPE